MTPIATIWLDKLIRPLLVGLDASFRRVILSSPGACELVLGTIATESQFKYPAQIGGPALGYVQAEPATIVDVVDSMQEHYPAIYSVCAPFIVTNTPEDLVDGFIFNLDTQIVICRLKYFLAPGRIPEAGNRHSQAAYYKKVYNTPRGKGSVDKYLADWSALVEPQRLPRKVH